MATPNGGDLLVQVLREAGVDTVFGIVSVHNLPLVEAVSRELRFVPVRHEASAVNAADGYARATGGLGCALTSTGTGAGNAAGALIESLASGTSVLHVTGQVESQHLGSGRDHPRDQGQLGMLTAVSAYAQTVTDADSAAKVLREAVSPRWRPPVGRPASNGRSISSTPHKPSRARISSSKPRRPPRPTRSPRPSLRSPPQNAR